MTLSPASGSQSRNDGVQALPTCTNQLFSWRPLRAAKPGKKKSRLLSIHFLSCRFLLPYPIPPNSLHSVRNRLLIFFSSFSIFVYISVKQTVLSKGVQRNGLNFYPLKQVPPPPHGRYSTYARMSQKKTPIIIILLSVSIS